MNFTPSYGSLVVAEDNPDDRLLLQEAWQEAGLAQLYLVMDGEDLMDFLHHQGQYCNLAQALKPDLIMLDLKMPRKNGYEALREIKAHPELRTIPVVVLSTSTAEEDISRSYALGACSYLSKPNSFDQLVELVRVLNKYWFETVLLPNYL
ncbi:two-component system response regulator [filamentous cyanobacterium CCP2]|nr:two-component system response regulator [filamentous cyanobacterium CCP2]